MKTIQLLQVSTRFILPILGLLTLILLSPFPEILILYDCLVTFTPFFLALIFAPNLQMYGYERARNAGRKTVSATNIRTLLIPKVFLCGIFSLLLALLIIKSSISISDLIWLLSAFIIYSLFCLIRALQHPLLVYNIKTKFNIGLPETLFSLFLLISTFSAVYLNEIITKKSISLIIIASFTLSLICTAPISKRVLKLYYCFFTARRSKFIIKQPRDLTVWLPSAIFAVSIIYTNIDRFVINSENTFSQPDIIIFAARITAICVSVWVFYQSLEYSPRVYKLYREKNHLAVFTLTKQHERRIHYACGIFLPLAGLGSFLLLSFKNATVLPQVLILMLFIFLKFIILVYSTIIGVLLTMQGKQKQLLAFGAIQCIPTGFFIIFLTHLDGETSLIFYLVISSIFSYYFYRKVVQKYEHNLR
jgi:hypothetical protein